MGLRAIIQEAWQRLGLDKPTLTRMIKFSLPPTIALSIYQADAVASTYGTVGYLIAIAAILSSVLAPRATYIEAAICNVLFISVSALVDMFACFTIIKARGGDENTYNSSASVVAGVWFVVLVFLISSVKFTRPQFKFACVMSSIQIIVTMTYAPQFTAMAEVLDLVKRLYGALMTGCAITTVISLFFAPMSCRQVVFKDMEVYIGQLRALLMSERVYMNSMELHNPFKNHEEGKDVIAKVRALRGTHGKLFADMGPAKREIAYGRLLPSDLSEIQRILRHIFLPSIGMSSIISIFERLSNQRGWGVAETDVETASEHKLSLEYQDVMAILDKPMNRLRDVLDDAFDHVLYQLKLTGWKTVRDSLKTSEQDNGERPIAGQEKFAQYLAEQIDLFYHERVAVLRTWCLHHNIDLSPDSFESDFIWLTNSGDTLFGTPAQRQLFIVLYMEYLFLTRAQAVLRLVRYADSKVADATMSRRRLILPGRKVVLKWVNAFGRSDGEDSMDNNGSNGALVDTTRTLWTETLKGFSKDPEHLPVTNRWQYIGTSLRSIGQALRSQHAQFGLRLSLAAMCIEIVAYLSNTQIFFVEQRLFWASIMVSVSMTRTSGQASFIYALRLCGTAIGAVASLVIHYIPDGHAPGILVFYFLTITAFGYIPIKKPKLTLAAVIATVTTTITNGYELQVMKIGVNEAITNKQLYQPIYLLVPYRLATTIVGICVAYIFTVFPFPISEGSELRRELGVAIYSLASYHSLVQETVAANISGIYGDLSLRTSAGRKLERARVKLMSRQMLLLQSLRAQANFTRWQFPLDAPFPRAKYEKIIDLVENIQNFIALVGHSSTGLNVAYDDASPRSEEWRESFQTLQDAIQQISDEVTSLFCLLSSSILYGQPLPPHLHVPPPYSLLQRMQANNRSILDISHVAEKGYSAFAVLQIASRSIIIDLYELVDTVRELVGQLDFSTPYSSTVLSRHATSKSKQY